MANVLSDQGSSGWFTTADIVRKVGSKARSLSLLPEAWRPPFIVLTTDVYLAWKRGGAISEQALSEAAQTADTAFRNWRKSWPRGLILRSSAEAETLEDRGANDSFRLPADFDQASVIDALYRIYRSFLDRNDKALLAVVVQPLVNEGLMGHLSNERRVSKTVNQWQWDRLSPDVDTGRINSQRDTTPDAKSALLIDRRKLPRMFGSVGKWVTELRIGPAHLEWIYDGKYLWFVQIDFEHDQPDYGIDPRTWLRESDHLPSGNLPSESPLTAVDLDPHGNVTPWRKIENVRKFAAVRKQPYPPLLAITGEVLLSSERNNPGAVEKSLEAFAHGRVVCRTDCIAQNVSRENLPRTSTVSSRLAVEQMLSFLERMKMIGAGTDETCFLAHKFIPARSGAWVKADPNSPIVHVDSLWGVPDGLQYLPHDTYDVDILRKAISSEKQRYKPRFIQECADGTWQELQVRRSLARTRSLPAADAIEISLQSHAIAAAAGKPLLIMWFCGIPQPLGMGSNLPWFSMPPNPTPTLQGETVSPRWPRRTFKTLEDIEVASSDDLKRHVLVLDPEVSLFRDEVFISKIISLALRDQCPVQLSGSTLAHAHYQLEKAGVAVVTIDGPSRARARGRRSFSKLVRNEIPSQIASHGELVVQSRLPRTEMRRALVAKLFEETQELLIASDPDEVKAELADLLEVVRAMATATGVAWAEVENTSIEKRARRGGFEEGAVLFGTEWPSRDRIAHKAPSLVSLRTLGRISSTGMQATASYNALLASTEGAIISLNGFSIAVRLEKDGIALDIKGSSTKNSTQLSLPFEVDDSPN